VTNNQSVPERPRQLAHRRGVGADRVIGRVRDMIQAGQLLPGDRLPAERELAAMLGVSRNSLREAVRALSLVNVLTVRQGDGTYVASLEPAALLGSTRFVVDLLQGVTVLELFELRRILEGWAAEQAAARIDQERLNRLGELVETMKSAGSMDSVADADSEFHRLIAEAAGNKLLASLLDSLAGQTLRTKLALYGIDKRTRDTAVAEHEEIHRSLVSRSPELAHNAAAFHVKRTEAWLPRLYPQEVAFQGGRSAALEESEESAHPRGPVDRDDGDPGRTPAVVR